MSAWRKLLSGSLALLVANLLAGVLNYAFQLRGAAALEPASYGVLNAWMAYVSLPLALAVAAQLLGNFARLSEPRLLALGAVGGGLGALFVGGVLLLPDRTLFGPWLAALASLGFGLLLYYQLGQLQVRLRFFVMGLGLAVPAAGKLAATFLPADGAAAALGLYYLALPFGFAAASGLVGAAIVAFPSRPDAAPPRAASATATATAPAPRRPGQEIVAALVLSFGMALIPQLDLINLRQLHDDVTLGLFARASVFAKAIFFAAVTVLQVSLPYHVRAAQGTVDAPVYRQVRIFETLSLAACVVGSVVLSFAAPIISQRFLGFDLEPYRFWVLLSSLALVTLYGQLLAIQIASVTGRIATAAIRIAVVSASMLGALAWRPASVTAYLGAAVIFYAATGLLFSDTMRRLVSRMRRSARVPARREVASPQ